ncbi:MFS transporter [Nocardia sp. CS682]|uniref:MFS transporter n=1 Tax=Nocardia sp. CS682 TaxID=1047172 RepID=UPI001074A14E|nr:MFS transporter [Nocardia sp. CS682]QBS39780.1 MFS transporter [Nocardia sp. CS682]
MDRSIPRVEGDVLQANTIRKITRRIVPLLMIGYIVSYIDRINVSFAKFGMEETFGMTATQYGFAAGIFFVGYVLAEVPSNIIMNKVGARIWLSRILVTWGIIATLTAFATSVEMVYVLRFLLGVAEAGFFPGILVYLTRWYPNAQRAKVISTVMVAIPVASVLGSPLNGWILDTFDGALGLDGWRWVFIVGGLPAVLLGGVFFVALTETPREAKWLSEAERTWLVETLAAENAERARTAPAGHLAALRNKRVLALCLAYFLVLCGAYPLAYWMPTVVREVGDGLSSTQIGWLSAVPFLLAAIGMYVTGRLVRAEGSSRPVLVALGISVVAFAITAFALGSPLLAFAAITVATMAAQTAKPLFWSVPTAYLAGAGAASGIALINSLGNAAGFVSPYAFGWIKDFSGGRTGFAIAVMIMANVGALLVIGVIAARSRPRRASSVATV